MEERICKYLGIEPEQILSYKSYEDYVNVIVDYGIAGGKKHTITFEELDTVEVEAKKVDVLKETLIKPKAAPAPPKRKPRRKAKK